MRISDWSSDVCSSDLDRQKFDFVGIGGAGDRIGAQQRPPLARQADHHELARAEAEARRAADREAEQMLVPVAYRTHLLDGQRGGGGPPGGFGARSEERCGGEGCGRTVRSQWSPDPSKKKTNK